MPRDLHVPPALRKPEPPAIRLALRPDEAAVALSICTKTLRDLGCDGPAFVSVGRARLYPVSSLQAWLDAHASIPSEAAPGPAVE